MPTDEHVDDPDPRGPDFDHPVPLIVNPRRFETFSTATLSPCSDKCLVCGEVHRDDGA